MRRAIRISGVALRGLVVATALGAAAFLLLPRLLGWQVVTVMSGSMAPTYPVDAVLALDPVDPAKVREGDVIAFETESDRPMVTHRVVAITHDAGGLAFVTKGDANEEADIDPVAASAVRGRVVVGIPYLGSFVRVVHNPVGFAIFLVLPGSC
jgi:signal peptidase